MSYHGYWVLVVSNLTVIPGIRGHQLPNTEIVLLYTNYATRCSVAQQSNVYAYVWSRYLRPHTYLVLGIDVLIYVCSCICVFFSARGSVI
jgi:hypothetical protein